MGTLEAAITARLREFQAARASLPARRAELDTLRSRLRAVDRDADPGKYFEMREAVATAERTVRSLETSEDEVEYLLSVAPIIKEYTDQPSSCQGSAAPPANIGGLERAVEVCGSSKKLEIYRRYLAEVEKKTEAIVVTRDRPSHACEQCDVSLVFDTRESQMLCPSCGVTRMHTEGDETNLSYEQEVALNPTSSFAYKRSNHFSEWLSALQAREATEIPSDVLEAVRAEFKKARAATRADIRPAKVREFLKKLKLQKWYEHVHSICSLLNGVPPPRLSAALEQQLKTMFVMIQAPFEAHCPPTRKNFLSYSYTLHKFCELLGEDDLLVHFPLLKSSEKLHVQDQIWKKICKDLGWQFIQSSNLNSTTRR